MKTIAILPLVACLVTGWGGWTAAAARPNVILVMTDDQGYGDLHCHGNEMIRTPNLDRLYAESVRLTDYHVDPTCSPTRAALMTGRYSTRTGVWHTIAGRSLIYPEEVTMAEVFKDAGYVTGIFGKWHLGDNYPMRPQDQGFDEVLVHGGGGIGQTPDYWNNNYFDNVLCHNGRWIQTKGYCTDVFFDYALRFIEHHRVQPFFVYLPTNAPHWPYNVDEKYAKPYMDKGVPATMARFYGMIENIDENVGRLLNKLKEWGLEENTIFILTTDNGTAAGLANRLPEGSTWKGFNAGMRGIKGSQYDGGHRVPCYWRWPAGGIGGKRDFTGLCAHIDVLPTLIDLCDLPPPVGVRFDGMSLATWLNGHYPQPPERTLFAHVQRQKLPPKWIRSAVMTSRWRLVDGCELYDITQNPGQEHDIAAGHPDVVEQLRRAYEEWWSSLQPAIKRFAWISLGADEENPTQLTCHDWHSNQVPWHQSSIQRAPWANGWWAVEVVQTGTYQFTLRQQRQVVHFPIEGDRARVKVGDAEAGTVIPEGADHVTLKLDLPAGRTRLQTWFTDEKSGKSRGAFFVEIRRLSQNH